MKLRNKILYMSFGAGLVILGMILNSLVSGAADAQVGTKDGVFRNVFCENLVIQDENGKWRGLFGLDTDGDAILKIFGDDGKTSVAYVGGNTDKNVEMMFLLRSKSTTDKRKATMSIDENGGRFDAVNKLGENVAVIGVSTKGGGMTDLRDKHGYKY